MIQQISIIN